MDPLNRLKRRLSKRSFPRAYEDPTHPYEDDESDTAYVHFVVLVTSVMHACIHLHNPALWSKSSKTQVSSVFPPTCGN